MLLVVATLLTGSVLLNNTRRSSLEAHKRQAQHEDDVLAKEIALAGLEAAISQVKRNFDTWREGFSDVSYLGGTYTVTVSGPPEGPVVITSVGTHRDVSRTLKVTLVRDFDFDAAVLVVAPGIEEVEFSGDAFLVSGYNTLPPSLGGGDAGGSSTHAVKTATAVLEEAFEQYITPNTADNFVGVGGNKDIVSGALDLDVEALYQEIKAKVPSSHVYSGGDYEGTMTFGTAASPGIFVFTDDVEFEGNVKGFGVMLVEGEFEASGNFTWEGLVFVRKKGELEIELSGNARIYGAVVIVNEEEEGISFEVEEGSVIPEVPFNARVEVLGAAISYGSRYAMPVTAAVRVGTKLYEPWGDYADPEEGNVNADAGPNAHPAEYVIPDAYPADTPITVTGTAWYKRWRRVRGRWVKTWVPYREIDSQNGGLYVRPLRNGDAVPNISGYLGQSSIEDFVAPYIGDDGRIELADNQVIYLFELGTRNLSSSAADFQDLVVLVTLARASEEVSHSGSSEEEDLDDGMKIEMEGNAQIHYSAQALQRIASLLDNIGGGDGAIVIR